MQKKTVGDTNKFYNRHRTVTWEWLHDFYVEISRKRSGRELDILVCVWISGKWISRFGNLQ